MGTSSVASRKKKVEERSTEERLAEFDRTGILRVSARDGSGVYTFVRGYPNIKQMPVALFWDGESGNTILHGGEYAHPEYGDQLAYWFGWSRHVPGDAPYLGSGRLVGKDGDPCAIVEIILQFIESGRPLWRNACGSYIGVDQGV